MISRRDFLIAGTALAGLFAGQPGALAQAARGQSLTQGDLLKFGAPGTVTLLHITDIHAQLVPIYFREPSVRRAACRPISPTRRSSIISSSRPVVATPTP